jgi:hypothetical protein
MKKVCITCNQEKDLLEFSKRTGATDGIRGECKKCHNKRTSKCAMSKNYKYQRKYWLNRAYKLTIEQFDELLIKQNNKCRICKKTFYSTPHIDHCHVTGKIRGLLCRDCNFMLGYGKDNITIFNNAISYLEQ